MIVSLAPISRTGWLWDVIKQPREINVQAGVIRYGRVDINTQSES